VDWAIYTATVATPIVDPTGPAVFLDGGSVRVDSIIAPVASLTNGSATAATLTIAAAGKLTVNQTYHQAANSGLKIEIAGPAAGQFGKITVADQATLGGTLELALVGGYVPTAGTEFEILSAGSLANTTFTTTTLPNLGSQLQWQIDYEPNAVIARVLAILAGDYNRDDAVGAADYVMWRKTSGTSVTSLGDGADGDHNGTIDERDYVVWRANFGQNATAASGTTDPTLVPEPTTRALLIVSALLYVRRSR
jgi:hypothetical protein